MRNSGNCLFEFVNETRQKVTRKTVPSTKVIQFDYEVAHAKNKRKEGKFKSLKLLSKTVL